MPHPTVLCTVKHPESNMHVALDPRQDYDPSDPLVRAYPWAFAPVERAPIESVRVETATAAPGEKRARR
jgi:hypothetical protein